MNSPVAAAQQSTIFSDLQFSQTANISMTFPSAWQVKTANISIQLRKSKQPTFCFSFSSQNGQHSASASHVK
jgi:purine-cytosine permease-like protein